MSLEKDRGTKKEEPVLITINTFSERIQVSHAKAREISRRKDLCDAGISVNINAGKRGGIRIDWIWTIVNRVDTIIKENFLRTDL